MAMYSMLALPRMAGEGMKPDATAIGSGFDSHSSIAKQPAIIKINATTSAST